MKRQILATLSIIPSLFIAIFIWITMLPQLIWQVPKANYYRIAKGMVLAKVRVNDNGTYTISYRGREKTLTKEEFEKKFGENKTEK